MQGDREILESLEKLPGKISLYYRPLDGASPALEFQAQTPVVAASVIKLPILIEAFRQREEGLVDFGEEFVLREEDKMPSCGALNYLQAGLKISMRDLAVLMIILSDNTATNLLIDRLGMEAVNATLSSLGAQGSRLRRKLFDAEAAERGLQNTVTARDMGRILEEMYFARIVSPRASEEMLQILSDQQLNGKIPFFLKQDGVRIAHKTGEDGGITHDVGIVFAKRPFVLCMLCEQTIVPEAERLMQEVARAFYRRANA